MKKLLLVVCCIPLLAIGQSRKQRKADTKADKETLEKLKQHVQYLASDQLEGRRTGSAGELLAAEYIARQFLQAGLEPGGPGGFIQAFTIQEGKQAAAADNHFTVNGQPLLLHEDFFPMAFSASRQVYGEVSPSLREKGQPWFWDVADLLEDNKNNPHFDLYTTIAAEAARSHTKGASALVVFNSSAANDPIQFNKNDRSPETALPVVCLTHRGYKKYFADPTASFRISLAVSLVQQQRPARNVAGFINNQAPTTIVLGAHFDHLGKGEDGNTLDSAGPIHNGADDNASGTAALLELAKQLKNNPARHNNYLFLAFSGEELGLLGSKYWLEHPTSAIPINYMINMDMIGRYDTGRKLTIGGYGTSPTWQQVLPALNNGHLQVTFDSSGSGPSDHASFYYRNIPVLFFFTNSHSDYHKATDDADKINFDGELEIIRYIRRVTEATDSRGKLPFTSTRDNTLQPVHLPVTLGLMPDYSFSGTGLRIEQVSKGKLAEKIGLQAGDILLQLGEYKFVDIPTYMQALGKFNKGDTTQLYLKRNNVHQIITVPF